MISRSSTNAGALDGEPPEFEGLPTPALIYFAAYDGSIGTGGGGPTCGAALLEIPSPALCAEAG